MRKFLLVIGWLMVGLSAMVMVYGIVSGVDGDRRFYERQRAYHEFDDEREAIGLMLDSLGGLLEEAENRGDSVMARGVRAEVDSIYMTTEYEALFLEPEPPIGFSLWGVVIIFWGMVSLMLLSVGVVIIAAVKQKMKHSK